jgi:hypothetical protein
MPKRYRTFAPLFRFFREKEKQAGGERNFEIDRRTFLRRVVTLISFSSFLLSALMLSDLFYSLFTPFPSRYLSQFAVSNIKRGDIDRFLRETRPMIRISFAFVSLAKSREEEARRAVVT